MKKAVFTNSYNAKKAVAPVQKKAPDDKMKSPKTGNDSLMVIWTTMILAVLEKEKRFSLYKEKCNMKKISLLFCLIILQAYYADADCLIRAVRKSLWKARIKAVL